jgi:fructokinase
MGRTAAFGDIVQAARFAAACAAITVSRPGADLPREYEVVVPPQLRTERGSR